MFMRLGGSYVAGGPDKVHSLQVIVVLCVRWNELDYQELADDDDV